MKRKRVLTIFPIPNALLIACHVLCLEIHVLLKLGSELSDTSCDMKEKWPLLPPTVSHLQFRFACEGKRFQKAKALYYLYNVLPYIFSLQRCELEVWKSEMHERKVLYFKYVILNIAD